MVNKDFLKADRWDSTDKKPAKMSRKQQQAGGPN